jgi:hypothetical protein
VPLDTASTPDQAVELEVVTYDPLRRRGFMRVAAGAAVGERVVFSLSYLPDELRRALVAQSRSLNDRTFTGEPFRDLMRAVRRELVGARFQGRVRGPAGRRRIAPRSLACGWTSATPNPRMTGRGGEG